MERQRKLCMLKLVYMLRQQQECSRTHWVRPVWQNRRQESEFFTVMRLMRNGDPSLFYKFFRMSPATFDFLHSLVEEGLTKEWLCREPVSSGERLAITLRYLSSGMRIPDVAVAFRVGIETARQAIHLTCRVLWEVLSPIYMKVPTEQEWREIAAGYWQRWQFPNCLGAVDGKHVNIKCPKNSGSLYYNYKGTYSIVLMAVVDSQYLFRLVDVGAPGRLSDGGVFKESPIGQRLQQGKLNLPRAAQLPGSQLVCPHVFVGDAAFQLRPDFMRPLPGSRADNLHDMIYNYRVSRARRCVENAFGILASRWAIYHTTINLEPTNAENAVKATCVLHNFLCIETNAAAHYCPAGFADFCDTFGNVCEGGWWQEPAVGAAMFPLEGAKARKSPQTAAAVRSNFIYFFSHEGQVPWQWRMFGACRPQ